MGRELFYKPGSFYRVDDRTGFPQRAERTRKEWTGLIVDERVWEPRQPQDLVRGVEDDQSVPDARPLAPDVFVGPITTTTTAACVIGQTVIPVEGTAGFTKGAKIGCMLDSGTVFFTKLAVNPTGGNLTLALPLPYSMASGNNVTNYQPSPALQPQDDVTGG